MGIPVLILGESGSGKSASLRNFDEKEVAVMNVAGKRLPFRKQLHTLDNARYPQITDILMRSNRSKCRRYVIDDSQYLLAFEAFERAKETGFTKFTEIAVNFYNLIQTVINCTPPDCIVYFLQHTDTDANGKVKAKTQGKMLDEKLTVEGLFSIVLLCTVENGEHIFVTQSDGYTTAKSPMEMFDLKIPNDLKMVDSTIREYYNL